MSIYEFDAKQYELWLREEGIEAISKELTEYVGFIPEEVETLCKEWGMDYEECRRLYKDYKGGLLFVGVNYDEKDKSHECRIERFEKK